jgi:hypothetical protein
MEKVELLINEKPIFVPDEMTLEVYQKYMNNSELYEKDTILFMSLLSGIPVNDLKNCSTDEIEILDFFLKTRIKIPEKQELILTFDYDGVSYGLENDWSKLAFGAWIDFEVYSAQDIYENLHKIMAILYRPIIKKGTFNVKKYKIVPYKSEEIEDRAEIMKNVPVSYWLGAAQFFFSIASISIKNMVVSLNTQNKMNEKMIKIWKKLPKFLQKRLPLDSILISRTNSQKKTLQNSKRLKI